MPMVNDMAYQILSMTDPVTVETAARMLADGGVVVAPTETRYGILVRADLEPAVQRLFEIKGRNTTNPTAIFVDSIATIERLGLVTPVARKLIAEFLPGPLTLVLDAKIPWTAPRVVDGKIGIRWSSSVFIHHVVTAVGAPLTATSANLSGQPDRESVNEIMADFSSAVDLYIDGGLLSGPVSTVVDCTGNSVRILREGAIPGEQIALIGERG